MFEGLNNFFDDVNSEDVIQVGTKEAKDKFLEKLKTDYDVSELQSILDSKDNLLIVAGAGSGKTTSLLLKIIHDILSGRLLKYVEINGQKYIRVRPILVSTFLRSGADDLAQKFDSLCKDYNIVGVTSKDISFRTIHSEVYNALREMGVNIELLNTADEQRLLKEACVGVGIKPVVNKSGRLTKEELADIACIITYSRNKLDNTKYMHPLMSEYRIDSSMLQTLLERYSLLRKAYRKQDFEDLQEDLLLGLIQFENVREYIQGKYDYVFVDEFQDTSQLQYAILKYFLSAAKGFICIGDDDQCIYSWRGSDVNLIQKQIEKDYSPTVLHLGTNRRCASVILEAVIPSIENNKNRHAKDLKSDVTGGRIDVVYDGNINYLDKCIKKDLEEKKTVGILGRTNADLLLPALLLQLGGCEDFSISKSLSLRDRLPKQVIGIMSLVLQRYNENFEGYFKLFLSRNEGYQATKLCDILASTPKYTIFNIPKEDLEYSAPTLYPIIRRLRVLCEEQDKLSAYLYLLDELYSSVYTGNTIYAARARDFVYYLKKVVTEHESLKGKSLEDIYKVFNETLPNELDKKRGITDSKVKVIDNSSIRVTTIHDAKGKEWDSVYIWNDVDGSFPNSVGKRQLTSEEEEEERRVHYIAWTRAKSNLTVFTKMDGSATGLLAECDLSNASIWTAKGDSFVESVKQRNRSVYKGAKTAKNWDTAFAEYVKKYTDFEFICTPRGNALDEAILKMGSSAEVKKYLEKGSIYLFPMNTIDRAISDGINDILETRML